jgi:hypothetical protein
MENKIDALRQTNVLLSRKLKSLDYSFYGKTNYRSEILFQSSNKETSLNILKIEGGQKSKPFIENEFQRIICISGELKITLLDFDEEMTLTSSNTALIPPQTKYVIETIKDSEVIVVFKPRKEIKEKIMKEKTIYNKV